MRDYRVPVGAKISLEAWDPDAVSGEADEKEEGRQELELLNQELEELQELLYAEHKHKVLIVLQAMDTGGKDGVIRHVFEGVNPLGVRVASFKVPSAIELDHDYLWRVHHQAPGRGEMVIFNRSHYEDVLVVRVHQLVPESTWKRRYDHITPGCLISTGATIPTTQGDGWIETGQAKTRRAQSRPVRTKFRYELPKGTEWRVSNYLYL